MPKKDLKDLKDFFDATKSVESEQEHDLSGVRRNFVLRILLSKYFLPIVVILLIVIWLILHQ